MRHEDFQALLGAIDDVQAYREGRRHDLRTTVLPRRPEPMDAAAIRVLRKRIGTSQAVFAMALNVSTKTVQAWESGARRPDGGNLKLLRVAEAHPEAVFGRLYQPEPQPEQAPAKPRRKPRAARKAPLDAKAA
jgi:putative transcriptional regulator